MTITYKAKLSPKGVLVMKFSVPQPVLLNLIQTVSKAVAVRTTKQVLTGILLTLTEDALTATAYDLELGIQDSVPVSEESGLKVLQPGAIVLSARYLTDVIKKLPNTDISIQVNNNYVTEIQSGTAKFHLHGIDAAEFPKLPVFFGAKSLTIPSTTLKELIRTTAFAASTSEVRPMLTGIYLQAFADKLVLTATDGLRLATNTVSLQSGIEEPWTAIIPAKSLTELSKILPDDAQPVSMQFGDSHSLFSIGSTLFYTRLIDGNYPDTSRIIPSVHKTEIDLPVEVISDAIDRAALIARDRENHMVRLEIAGSELTVSSSSPEIGNVSETVSATSKQGDDLLIAFNARYVLDALRTSYPGEVKILFNGSNQPFILKQEDQGDGLQLISPVLMR